MLFDDRELVLDARPIQADVWTIKVRQRLELRGQRDLYNRRLLETNVFGVLEIVRHASVAQSAQPEIHIRWPCLQRVEKRLVPAPTLKLPSPRQSSHRHAAPLKPTKRRAWHEPPGT
jgi:hypothetical protein